MLIARTKVPEQVLKELPVILSIEATFEEWQALESILNANETVEPLTPLDRLQALIGRTLADIRSSLEKYKTESEI